jgi:hypothetical protein
MWCDVVWWTDDIFVKKKEENWSEFRDSWLERGKLINSRLLARLCYSAFLHRRVCYSAFLRATLHEPVASSLEHGTVM